MKLFSIDKNSLKKVWKVAVQKSDPKNDDHKFGAKEIKKARLDFV